MDTLEHIEHILSNHKLVFISLTKPDCEICKFLKPRIEKILADCSDLKVLFIDLEKLPAAAGKYSVSKLPTLLIYAMGKEVYRADRSYDTDEIRDKIDKYHRILF